MPFKVLLSSIMISPFTALEFMRAKSKTAGAVLPKPGNREGHVGKGRARTLCAFAAEQGVKFPGLKTRGSLSA